MLQTCGQLTSWPFNQKTINSRQAELIPNMAAAAVAPTQLLRAKSTATAALAVHLAVVGAAGQRPMPWMCC